MRNRYIVCMIVTSQNLRYENEIGNVLYFSVTQDKDAKFPISLMAENLLWSLQTNLVGSGLSSSFLPPGMPGKFPGTKRASDLGLGRHCLVSATLASAEGCDTILKA